MNPGRTRFQTELQVRPDDLDMNRHVHSSKYLDYVLAARYDQMARCYGVSMEKFLEAGYGWVVQTAHVEFKRPLGLGDSMVVQTWVEAFHRTGVRVDFEIFKKDRAKLACQGYCDYTMIRLETGRAEVIPDWIVAKYIV